MNRMCDRCGVKTALFNVGAAKACVDCRHKLIDELSNSSSNNPKHVARQVLRESGAESMLIRDIPAPLVERWGNRALAEKRTRRDVFLDALRAYLR